MPESTERILTSWSIDRTGPLTARLTESSSTGWIDPQASHWSIEAFLPFETQTLTEYLIGRAQARLGTEREELDASRLEAFRTALSPIAERVQQRTSHHHARFSDLYRNVDPDSDCQIPGGSTHPGDERGNTALMQLCREVLEEAAYARLSREDIEQCVGVASDWGVPLSVDFDLFERLEVYARGDIIGKRCRRSLRRLYRPQLVDVAIYQRLAVLFELSEDYQRGETLAADQFHLRLFKNIPKQDVDMLLPGTKVRLSKLDQAKVIVPSVGGWLLSLQKISRFVLVTLALAAYYSVALVIGLLLAAIGYLVKSFFSYFQTRDRYLLDLTRSLYFQKLDANAGAGFQIIQQAGRQTQCEALVAFYALLSHHQPISRRRLRRQCERLVREAIDLEIDFRVDRAVTFLTEMGLVAAHEDTTARSTVVAADAVVPAEAGPDAVGEQPDITARTPAPPQATTEPEKSEPGRTPI